MESSKKHKISYIINTQTTNIQCCFNECCPFKNNLLQYNDSSLNENILWSDGVLKLFVVLKMMDETTLKVNTNYSSIFNHNFLYFSQAVKNYIDQHGWLLFPNKPKCDYIKYVKDTLSHHPNFESGKRRFKKNGYWRIRAISKGGGKSTFYTQIKADPYKT